MLFRASRKLKRLLYWPIIDDLRYKDMENIGRGFSNLITCVDLFCGSVI